MLNMNWYLEMSSTYKHRIRVVEKHNPKIDHNITLAGLLVTDADRALEKLEREKEGLLKGLYVFRKKVSTGEVCICNGAEFPNAEAVDLLLYLIIKLEDNDWDRKLTIESIRKLLKEVFEVDTSKFWTEKLRRLLVIWKNHSFYFPGNFFWDGKKIEAYFGVIEDFYIDKPGKGKSAKIEITFNEKFVEICRNTTWYRRPPWIEIKKLRKEIAKRLYMLALEYKPAERSQDWKVYIDNDLKSWYRNALNSLADPKHLRPSIILKRLKGAIEEINKKTNLRMELQQTEEGNYCITVEEIAPPGAEKIEIPFDKLTSEEKAILVAYLEAVAEEKRIENIWGFLRSMTTEQVKDWLKKAEQYFESEVQNDNETEFKEKPRLIEILREWGRKQFDGKKALFNVYFGKDKILKAYESNKRVVFVCADEILAKLILERFGDKLDELKELFGKEVEFTGEDLKR